MLQSVSVCGVGRGDRAAALSPQRLVSWGSVLYPLVATVPRNLATRLRARRRQGHVPEHPPQLFVAVVVQTRWTGGVFLAELVELLRTQSWQQLGQVCGLRGE